ncbi:unnamed protein product [Rotaria sordida]|uniref:Major facilitator superfamily (MFS) profile domain-containing protein n=1 Tax=Rotaria sordida TaxID=392033 RepID=A0A815ZKY7_9BILA|nr:unnamed protein product [Rotaria sordida]CAF1586557.1 unnamed protein product [Rotaria sordida]
MEEVSLENVIRRCGDFNRFQLIHYIFLSFLTLSSGINGFYYVFGLAEPDFYCRLSSNYSTSKCEDINGSTCNEFVYDRTIFGRTFTEEAGYVCSKAIKKTWLSTAYEIGAFAVLVTGSIADKIGRRKMIQILTIGLFSITVLTQALLQFVKMNINSKFILLFINQVVSAIDSYCIAFLLLMELTSSTHTSFACSLTLVAYTIGEVLLTIFAYVSRDWLLLKWIISIYFSISLPYLYFVPESPYWLLARKKYHELEICLRKMAKMNGRSEDRWLSLYNQLVDDTRLTEATTNEGKPTKRKFLRHLSRLAICGFIEFVTMLSYTKISYRLAAANGTLSPYWDFIIGAVVEAIGYLIAGALITTLLGRKYSLISFATLTSICVFIIPFIMKSYPLATVIVSQLGKLSVSSTVCVAWIYVPELFPTSMRGLANAVFVFLGSFGSILAPIIDEALSDKYVRIPFYFYSGLIIVLVLIICTLPETRNHSFDDEEDRNDVTQTGEANIQM